MKAVMSTAMMCLTVTIVACGSPSTQKDVSTGTSTANDTRPEKDAKRDVELQSGTIVTVRLERALSTVRNRAGDTFEATLDEPVVVDGTEILARGTKFTGHVTTSEASGRLKGRAVLGITLDAFDTDGQHHPIKTSLAQRTTEAHKRRNLEIIGGSTGVEP